MARLSTTTGDELSEEEELADNEEKGVDGPTWNETGATQWPKGLTFPLGLNQECDFEVLKRDYTSSPLCRNCDVIFTTWPAVLDNIYNEDGIRNESDAESQMENKFEVIHWGHILLLKQSAAQGCHMCAQFYGQVAERADAGSLTTTNLTEDSPARLHVVIQWDDEFHTPVPNTEQRISSQSSMPPARTVASLELFQSESDLISDGGPVKLAEIFVRKLDLGTKHFLPENQYSDLEIEPVSQAASSFSSCTSDAMCFQQAMSWLQICRDTHKCHDNSASSPKLPTRLIALDERRLRLISSVELSKPIEYTTLSHCWGKIDIIRLTTNNLKEFQDCIPWDKMSKTFQDACFAVQELGFNYIWIDSLCIIQDSAEDWEREAVLMSQVYGQPSLNIAAAKAHDGSEGLFAERDPKAIQVLQARLPLGPPLQSSNHGKGQPRPDRNHQFRYEFFRQRQYEELILETPLAKRAWVMQERFLSPRTLYFSNQLAWVCKIEGSSNNEEEGFRCETFPNGLPDDFVKSPQSFYDHDEDTLHWTKVVQEYTRCGLTFDSDRLVAIGGIARKLQARYKDDYLAGLWKGNFAIQLLWFGLDSERERVDKPGNVKFTPPTWSWANSLGHVKFYHSIFAEESSEVLLHLNDVRTVSIGSTPFGNVDFGEVTLRSPYLVPVASLNLPKVRNMSDRYTDAIIWLGDPKEKKSIVGCVNIRMDSKILPQRLFLLGVVISNDLHSQSKDFVGIVLRATSNKQGEYERVGFFEIGKQGKSYRKTIKLLAETKPDTKDYIGTPERDGEGRATYTISLI